MALPYCEGTAFYLPLTDGKHYARGVVARMAPRGRVLFGYFFGPGLDAADASSTEGLTPDKAVYLKRFGDLGLMNGTWMPIGQIPNWSRADWPMPNFVRYDSLGFIKPRIVQYADNNSNKVVQESITTDPTCYQRDGLAGYRYVESILTRLLHLDPKELPS